MKFLQQQEGEEVVEQGEGAEERATSPQSRWRL